MLREVLHAGGLKLPASPHRAAIAIFWERLRLRWRGFAYRERLVEDVSADDLERIDLCWAATAGLSLFDVVSGAYFQAVHLRHALAAGEPQRVVRALAWDAAHISAADSRAGPPALRLLGMARQLADRLAHPQTCALLALAEGIVHHNLGDWQRGYDQLREAHRQLCAHCMGVTWERDVALAFQAWALFQMGKFTDLAALAEQFGRDANLRNDHFAAAHLAAFSAPMARLLAGDPAGARQAIHAEIPESGTATLHLPRVTALLSECRIDLYEGNSRRACERLESVWDRLVDAGILRAQRLRVVATHLRGGIAAAMSREQGLPARHAAKLERERSPWATSFADLIRAAILFRDGQSASSAAMLASCSDSFNRAGMPAYAAAARYWRGLLLHDGEAREEAEGFLRTCGAAVPDRLAAALIPGFDRSSPEA